MTLTYEAETPTDLPRALPDDQLEFLPDVRAEDARRARLATALVVSAPAVVSLAADNRGVVRPLPGWPE